jgi:nicotinamidase-related amidase
MTTPIYEQKLTALLIVDPYNDFMSEGGKLYNVTKETANAVGYYDNMRKLIPAVRATGIQVFIVPHHRTREDDFDNWLHVNPTQVDTKAKNVFAVGTWGGEWHPEFGPKPGDVIVLEHWAQNGFANTDLDAQLKQRGIQKIVLVGFIANSCVEATGRFGMELGYHVTLVSDATAAFNPEGMTAARVNGPMFAHATLTTNELLAALPEPMRFAAEKPAKGSRAFA